jgi:hypothetical protein
MNVDLVNEDNDIKVEIILSKSEYFKLYKDLEKNNLCINIGMIPITPLYELGQNILDIIIIKSKEPTL